MKRRVVVTGLGVVSSIGIGRDAFWNNLVSGKSGVSPVTRFDTSEYDVTIGGEVKDFEANRYVSRRESTRLGRAAQFAIAASKLAVEDANLTIEKLAGSTGSVCLGTTMAEAQALERLDEEITETGHCKRISIRHYARQYPSCMIAAHVARYFRIKGPAFMFGTACAAGNYSIAYGTDLIRLGKCEVVLAGGADPFSRTAFMGFGRLFALAPDKCRPFDRNRKGIIVGEGAGMLLLESLEHAIERGVEPYAEVLGYGTSCDASHMTIPDVKGVVAAMRNALLDAGISASDVDYINAHGTGTPANDKTECLAIGALFTERDGEIPVSSIKSMLGHTMGAASAIEAIACSLVVQRDTLPPTINYETPDEDCPIDCVPNRARRQRADVVLNNSFAFGGNNACVVFGKVGATKRGVES